MDEDNLALPSASLHLGSIHDKSYPDVIGFIKSQRT